MPFAREDDLGGRVVVASTTPRVWQLAEDLTYTRVRDGMPDESWTAPVGYRTDFATVPRIASWLIPVSGRWTRAAIIHDYLLTDYVAVGRMSSIDADETFREALRDLGCSWLRQGLMWCGVRWGAAFSRTRRGEWWRTLPQVTGMTLVGLLFVPEMLVVGLGLLKYSLLAGITSGGRHWGDLSS